ncbi:Uncharacterized protein HKD37_19G052889 [Glycine soja]|uniref:COX assembly mitochondrial protein n=1 Tax=Glycine soja TaxID=3848 RepID=A0A445FCA1_GLYSO|nr:putative protein isoform C [Glycine soja]
MGYIQDARQNHVKKKVEEALRSKMKQKALKECDHYTAKYAECALGRTLSVVWRCRQQAQELNDCLHQLPSCFGVESGGTENSISFLCHMSLTKVEKHHTNDSVLEEMKKEYMLKQGEGSTRIQTA